METLLRLAFEDAGLPTPLLNEPIIDPTGIQQHSPDFQWPDYRLCAEYDGAPHDSAERQKRDIRRERSASAAGFTEIRLFSEDARAGCAPAISRIRAELLRRGWTV